jgi:hypothetical protein
MFKFVFLFIIIFLVSIPIVNAELININNELIIQKEMFTSASEFDKNKCYIFYSKDKEAVVNITCKEVYKLLTKE